MLVFIHIFIYVENNTLLDFLQEHQLYVLALLL